MTDTPATIPCPLRATALLAPDTPAIARDSGEISYAALDRMVSGAAVRLAGLGLGKGVRVALYLPEDERYVALLLALLRVGVVACPVSTRLPPEGVAAAMRVAGCEALISPGEPPAALEGAPRNLPLETFFSDAAAPGPPVLRPVTLPLDRLSTVVFTTGSTGTPKAALHTFGNHYHSAIGSNTNITLGPGDRWLHSLPLYHVGGLSVLFRCLLAGAAIVLPDSNAPLGESIVRLQATHVSLVATQLRRLFSEDGPPLKLKAALMGASAMPPGLIDEAHARGLPIHTSYGLTEMASQVTATPPSAPLEDLHSSGRVLPHREISVAEDGEILVRGRTLFAGYAENGGMTRPLDAEGWFHTRDLGELSPDGSLHVRGRKDNMFVSGGENVQPEEIEASLLRLPGVEEAAVVPVPDPEFGARPVAFVRRAPSDTPTDLREALERALPRFKVPLVFHPWPTDAPVGMKVDRAFLRERARHLCQNPDPSTKVPKRTKENRGS